jgi:hypothetical protein
VDLNLHLTPETEIKLHEFVVSTGKRPEEVVLEALNDKLASEPPESAAISTEEWLQQFDTWMSSLVSHNPAVNDSRESFYPDRW